MLTIHRHHPDANDYLQRRLIDTRFTAGILVEIRGHGFERIVCAYHNNYLYVDDYDISISERTNMFAMSRKVMAYVE